MRATSATLVALALAIPPLRAQNRGPADSLLARGDTSAAIVAYEAAVKKDMRNAEAHYRVGNLYLLRFLSGPRAGADRRKAEEHLRNASRFAPDSAKYLIALADVLRTEDNTFARLQVQGLLERAREAARKSTGMPDAQAEYRIARLEWQRYEAAAHRHLFTFRETWADPFQPREIWDSVEAYFAERVFRDPKDPGSKFLEKAEDGSRTAITVDSGHIDAAGLLVIALGEREAWKAADTVTTALIRTTLDSGRAHALHALVLARLGRWVDARATFHHALSLMTPWERGPYDNLGMILARADSIAYMQRAGAEQTVADSFYWAARRPLSLSPSTDGKTEFYARVTYALHRWSDPFRGYLGVEADQGAVHVRYGPPDYVASLSRGGRPTPLDDALGPVPAAPRTGPLMSGARGPIAGMEAMSNVVIWLYRRSQTRFYFAITPGFARARFGGEFREVFRSDRDREPVRFDNIEIIRSLDSILTQIAQFAGDSGTDIAVFGQAPMRRLVLGATPGAQPFVTAAVVKDREWRDVVHDRREETVPDGMAPQIERRSWRFTLRPADYFLRLEAYAPSTGRAARSAGPLRIRSFDSKSFMLSDLLVAAHVAPRDSIAPRWTDFFIDPAVGRFLPGEPVALLWEIYNLSPDSTGTARYRVDVRFTIRQIQRRNLVARVLGGVGDAVGLSARGNNQATLSFTRQVALRPGAPQVEYLTVDLEDAPQASYGVVVTVVDERTGRIATAERNITVTRIGATR